MPDPDPHSNSTKNGPSNDVVEKRTWDWFHATVAARFGPAHFRVWTPAERDHWPDVIALRGHEKVGFEITSPLKPEDVVTRPGNETGNGFRPASEEGEDERVVAGAYRQKLLEQRVVGALKRKIKKYGEHHSGIPLALLITLAHPSSLKFSSTHTDIAHLASVVRGHFGKFLHQPIDAVYLVGPGEKAFLLWRRRGPKWKKLFPELDDITART
jgi:hypothetical protein